MEDTLHAYGVAGLTIDSLKLFLILYATDAVMLSESWSESREDLQSDLNHLSNYCERWKLILNVEKTKMVFFSIRRQLGNRDKWYYNDAELEIVTHFTYLVVVLSRNGSFSKSRQTLARQPQKAVFSMFRMTNKYMGLNPFIMCDLFHKMILPILTYGSEVWGYHKGDAIERIHRK